MTGEDKKVPGKIDQNLIGSLSWIYDGHLWSCTWKWYMKFPFLNQLKKWEVKFSRLMSLTDDFQKVQKVSTNRFATTTLATTKCTMDEMSKKEKKKDNWLLNLLEFRTT